MRKPNHIKVIDLFAGCGGLSLGFQNAGFNIVAAYDFWEPAIKTYRKNFEHPIFECDLSKLENFDIFQPFKADMLIAGSPCQDFSSAGKRNEESGKGDLTILFAKIIAELKPRWFLLENVTEITKSNKWVIARKIFKECGYGLTEETLNASLCGVPQNRKRFFCIGEINQEDHQIKYALKKNLADKPLTVREYLGTKIDIEHYYRHPRTYARRGVFSIDEPSPAIRGVNRPIPKTYKSHAGDTVMVSPGLRHLTTRERSYIQTFPENFIFEGSKTDIEQMIGNAVPVKMAEYIGNCLLESGA